MSFLGRLLTSSQYGSPRAALARPLLVVHSSYGASTGGQRSPRLYRRYVSPACTFSCLLLLFLAQALLALVLLHTGSSGSLFPAVLLPHGWAAPATDEQVVAEDAGEKPDDTSNSSDSSDSETVDEWFRRGDLLRMVDEQLARLRTRWWYARVPRLLWPLFCRAAPSLGIVLTDSDVAVTDGTWFVAGPSSAGSTSQNALGSVVSSSIRATTDSTVSSSDDRERADIEMAAKLRALRAEVERMDLKAEADNDRAGVRLLDLLHGRKEREVQSFFDTWRRANADVAWPPSSPLSLQLEEWNRRPVRAPVAASRNAEKDGGSAMGLLEKLRARVRGRRGGKHGTASSGSGGRGTWERRLNERDVVVVMYVHKRPAYLRRLLHAMSKVDGINDTLLIVSHDGYYPEMHALVRNITFCAVKQIYFPFSPHLFPNSFPGASPDDCQGKALGAMGRHGGKGGAECTGQADQYGSFRDAGKLSLKHHWWWAMNTVWEGLEETRGFQGHVLCVEEDHMLFPNALANLQALLALKNTRCPHCIAANLAPSEVSSIEDDEAGVLSAERMGNVGYAFNRTVWDMLHSHAKPLCLYDDYNWDLTLWASILHRLPTSWSLRWSRASAQHVGSCGLHAGRGANTTAAKVDADASAVTAPAGTTGNATEGGVGDAAKDGEGKSTKKSGICSIEEDGIQAVELVDEDNWMMVNASAPIVNRDDEKQFKVFRGWGGWGDGRDIMLCMHIARMYQDNDNS